MEPPISSSPADSSCPCAGRPPRAPSARAVPPQRPGRVRDCPWSLCGRRTCSTAEAGLSGASRGPPGNKLPLAGDGMQLLAQPEGDGALPGSMRGGRTCRGWGGRALGRRLFPGRGEDCSQEGFPLLLGIPQAVREGAAAVWIEVLGGKAAQGPVLCGVGRDSL